MLPISNCLAGRFFASGTCLASGNGRLLLGDAVDTAAPQSDVADVYLDYLAVREQPPIGFHRLRIPAVAVPGNNNCTIGEI